MCQARPKFFWAIRGRNDATEKQIAEKGAHEGPGRCIFKGEGAVDTFLTAKLLLR